VGLFPQARQSAIEVCGSSVEAAYARKSGTDWGIERARGDADGGGFTTHDVAVGAGMRRYPDIACAGGRVFVSWSERDGVGDQLFISHAVRSVGDFVAEQSLGVDDDTRVGRSLAVAGVNDTAYAVFARSDGQLRLRRWLVGAGPSYPVSAPVTKIIGPGTPGNPAIGAHIAAAGNKVAVTWYRCQGVFARVSKDKGLTWGPVRKLVQGTCAGDFGAGPTFIAMRGGAIVVTYGAAGLDSGWMGIIRTKSDFASFNDRHVTSTYQSEHLVGYVTKASTVKLAAAFDTGDRVRFRRQQ
jgi:hypothetical protein